MNRSTQRTTSPCSEKSSRKRVWRRKQPMPRDGRKKPSRNWRKPFAEARLAGRQEVIPPAEEDTTQTSTASGGTCAGGGHHRRGQPGRESPRRERQGQRSGEENKSILGLFPHARPERTGAETHQGHHRRGHQGGGRVTVRLRLLDDVEIDGSTVRKGTYLYATVSGFSSGRVKGSISSILVGDELVKVSLSLYDTDGLEGLYVPESQFRETGKDVASSAMSGNLSMNTGGYGNNSPRPMGHAGRAERLPEDEQRHQQGHPKEQGEAEIRDIRVFGERKPKAIAMTTIEQDKIYNMDCLEGMKGIADRSIDAVIADLPYGVLNRQNGAARWDNRIPLKPLWEQYLRITKPDSPIILFAQGMFSAELVLSQPKLWRYNLVWHKDRVSGHLNANRMPLRQHEDILVFYRKLPVYHPQMIPCPPEKRNHGRRKTEGFTNRCYGGMKLAPVRIADDKYPTSVISVPKEHRKGTFYHPTQKTCSPDRILDTHLYGRGRHRAGQLYRLRNHRRRRPADRPATTSASRQTAAIAGLRSGGYGKRLNRGKEKITRKNQ